jgi:hypothetical protein
MCVVDSPSAASVSSIADAVSRGLCNDFPWSPKQRSTGSLPIGARTCSAKVRLVGSFICWTA